MVNPLAGLSAMQQAQSMTTDVMHFTPLTNAQTAAPIGENFNGLLGVDPTAQLTQAGVLQADPTAQAAAAAQASLNAPLAGGASPSTWGHMVQQMVMDVNAKQQTAAAKVTDVLAGGPTPVHEAVISSEEASLSFELLAEMRNKVVDAYNQVMQMQV